MYCEAVPYLEDYVRERLKLLNATFPINYYSHSYNKDLTKLQLYARCLYSAKGCSKFRITINFEDQTLHVVIRSTRKTFLHRGSKYKNLQLRGVRRRIIRHEIKKEKAANWKNKRLLNQKKPSV